MAEILRKKCFKITAKNVFYPYSLDKTKETFVYTLDNLNVSSTNCTIYSVCTYIFGKIYIEHFTLAFLKFFF